MKLPTFAFSILLVHTTQYLYAPNSIIFFALKFTRFASLGRVYLLGDTNARLGSLLKDKDIHGKFITNQNSHLLLNFLEFSGLTILNKVFCSGVPTYEIVNKKRSIIDLCLTNSLNSVEIF